MTGQYDVVIIGSGLGGLLCGVILAAEGQRVCILEKNKQVGGSLQCFVRDRCILDTGVHYIGGFGENQSLRQYFRYAGIMDDLKLLRMDEDAFDIITFEGDGQEYPQAQGYKRFSERLIELFPQEREGILKYCELMQAYCDMFPMYSLNMSNKYPDNFDHLNLNARDAIAGLVQDPKLRAVLAGNNMVYVGDGEKTPFYVHALVVNAYIESSWRCVDGGGQISKLLVRQLRKHGGDIFKHCEVTKFHFSGSEIESVELKNGERIMGKRFISNIHPAMTLAMIDEDKTRKAYRSRILSLEETVASFTVHVTLEPNTVPYINSNYYHLQNHDAWNLHKHTDKNWPLSYMLSMGVNSKNPNYTDSIALMTYMNYSEVAQWGDSFNTVATPNARNEAYEAFKQEKTDILVAHLLKKMPELRGKIKGIYASSPLSYRDYIGSPTGSLYGILHDCRNPTVTMISPNTKIKNLWMTGQNTNLHGILGVTVGAYLTCFELLGRDYLLPKILKS